METPENCSCKIGQAMTEYGLSIRNTYLVNQWRDGRSIRDLTIEFNKNIIESVLTAASVDQGVWRRIPVYKVLHTDELERTEEIEIRRELERAGVDVEQLSADLVSHQTVYRHLTTCLEVSKDDEKTPEQRRENALDTIHALQQRTELVTEPTIESLLSADIINHGNTEVLVGIQVVCNDCGQSMDLETAIRDGCHCGPS